MKPIAIIALGLIACSVGTNPNEASADDIDLALRTQYFFDDFSTGGVTQSPDGTTFDFLIFSEPFEFPMIGGSLSYRSDRFLPSTRFTFSALFGESEVDRILLGASPVPEQGDTLVNVKSIRIASEAEAERVDLELSSETRINDFISVVAGVRYEESIVDFDATITRIDSNNGGAPNAVEMFEFKEWYKLYTARLGVAGAIPLDDQRQHNIYTNAQVFLGARDTKPGGDGVPLDDATLGGPDLSIGYNYRLSEEWILDARYRASIFFFLSGRRELGETKVTHGPSLSLVKRF